MGSVARGAVVSGGLVAALSLAIVPGPNSSAVASAQQPTFRAAADVIAVETQVIDKDGHPILDLTPANFAVSVNGQKRKVLSADLIRYDTTTTPVATSRATMPTPVVAPPTLTASAPAPGRDIIVAIDGLTFDIAASRGVVGAAQGFIDRLQPADRVGLFTYPLGPKMDPTTDHAAVRAAIDKVMGQRNPPGGQFTLSPSDIVDITAGDPGQALHRLCGTPLTNQRSIPTGLAGSCRDNTSCAGLVACEVSKKAMEGEAQTTTRLGMLGDLLRSLGRVPGRKIVVLVSAGSIVSDRPGGRPDVGMLPTELGRQAAQSDVTIYTLFIDQGLLQQGMAENQHGTGGGINEARNSQILGRWLDLFSGSAGGTMLTDLIGSGEGPFDRILTETSAYYLLGVQPEDKDRDGHEHEISVKVDRHGVTVRNRAWAVVPKRDGSTVALAPSSIPAPAPAPATVPAVAVPPSSAAASTPAPSRAPAPPAASASPALTAILQAVGDYLTSYGHALSAIVAEETYRQEVSGDTSRSRNLRSDVLFFMDDPSRWGAFRDVFEADGKAVRDRDDRLAKLMITDASPDARQQAVRIAQESARFNLNVAGVSVNRTLNVPIATLLFFRTDLQHRSAFKIARTETVGGKRAVVVSFEERAMPRLFVSQDNVAMHGDAWIEPDTGRVLRTDLAYSTSGVAVSGFTSQIQTEVSITVVFADEPRLGVYVPKSMEERYQGTAATVDDPTAGMQGNNLMPGISTRSRGVPQAASMATLSGRATYANFRRFDVSVGTEIKK